MLILITYDVDTINNGGKKRLRQVAKACLNHGQRVQNSVFECLMNEAQIISLKHILEEIIDKKNDSIRFYYLGNKWKGKVEYIGVKTSFDMESEIII